MRSLLAIALASLWFSSTATANPHDDRVHVTADSDSEAVAIAQSVMANMGGWEAWDATRYLCWNFYGTRRHIWDRNTGNIRIEPDSSSVILMNLNTKEGRAWENGKEITHPDSLAKVLLSGDKMWVNDSYWMFMPYKLLDPGVILKYLGERNLEDGRAADVLELTFTDGTGYTSQNKYDVFVAKDTGLVEQWTFYTDRTDPESRFTGPWAGWTRFGGIMLATSHGRERAWEISTPAEVPLTAFTSPEPVPPAGLD